VPGNSQRKGATRTGKSRKGANAGSGGQRRQGLEPTGPTPKATERTGHPAARRAKFVAKRSEATTRRRGATGARKESPEYVYGRNPVVEAMRGGVPGNTLYVQQYIETDDRVREALTIAGETRLPLLEVPRSQLDTMTNHGVHQGLVLAVPPYEYADATDFVPDAIALKQSALIVALDGITDPRNLGAIVRSAAAFGAHGVIIPERRAAGMTASAWKTSAGAASRVRIARVTNLTRALKAYADAGCMIIGLAAGGQSLDAMDRGLATGPVVLVVGSEGEGLSRLVSETCDVIVGIPMTSTTESLNAGVAAGVALYEIARARRTKGA
jgi:23S rRNA (guanosine2251-2'-O)-methyltransferase